MGNSTFGNPEQMGLKRTVSNSRNPIAMETTEFNGRKMFVVRRGFYNDQEEWTYTQKGINFNRSTFQWFCEKFLTNLPAIIDHFSINTDAPIPPPTVTKKLLTGSCYELVHNNGEQLVHIDSTRNPSLADAHHQTLAITLLAVQRALNDYFDLTEEAEIDKLNMLINSQLKAAKWKD